MPSWPKWCEVVGFAGELAFDPTKPDGTPRKLLDTSRLTAWGWRPRIGLSEGLERTYRWFVDQVGRDDEMPKDVAPQ